MKMHPAESQLRKVSQLTPALRELVARMARSEARDALQGQMEGLGVAFSPGAHVSRAQAIAAMDTVRDNIMVMLRPESTQDEVSVAAQAVNSAYSLIQYTCLTGPISYMDAVSAYPDTEKIRLTSKYGKTCSGGQPDCIRDNCSEGCR